MPVILDFSLPIQSDATLAVAMQPSTNVSGWTIEFNLMKRFGGEPRVARSCASGYNNVSGVNVTDGSLGYFTVSLRRADTSGQDYGVQSYQINRNMSGRFEPLCEGFVTFTP